MTFACIQGERRGLQRQLTADGHWAHKASCNFPTTGALLSRPEDRRGEGTVSHVSVQPQTHGCLSFPLDSWGLPCPRRMGVGRAQGTQQPLTFVPSWLHKSLHGPCHKEERVTCYEDSMLLNREDELEAAPTWRKMQTLNCWSINTTQLIAGLASLPWVSHFIGFSKCSPPRPCVDGATSKAGRGLVSFGALCLSSTI